MCGEMPGNEGRLLLFDAAGTLIEPAEPVEEVYCRCFAAAGWKADAAGVRMSFRRTFAEIGDPDFSSDGSGEGAEKAWWRRVVEETARAGGVVAKGRGFEDCFEGLFEHYAAGSAWRVFPEVGEVLERFKRKGFRMAVVSNFDRRLHRVLEEAGLSGWFDAVLTSADVSARKPSPRLLEEVMRRFGIAPSGTKLTGDSEIADGGAGRAAGVEVFLLERPEKTLAGFETWVDEFFC